MRVRHPLPRAAVIAVILALIIGSGCVHRVGSSQPITDFEKVVTYNAVIAETNNGVERGVELVPTTVLPLPIKTAILAEQRKIAIAHKEVTAIIDKGRSSITSGDAAQLRSLLGQIKGSSDVMLKSGAVGVKNPTTQATFSDEIKGIANLADLVLTGLQQAGVLK